jgi:hypothetical protein
MSATAPQPGRKRPAPETAKDLLGQLDTARAVAEAAGFTNAAATLAEAEQGIDATLAALETALQADLTALLHARPATND